MNYLEWNNAIAARFFRDEMADRRVFLAVTEAEIQRIGKGYGVGSDDFLCAVRTGPPWTSSESDVCRKALAARYKWHERNFTYPPYIAFLAVFVMAADSNEDFGPLAYYGPLSKLLDQSVGINQFKPTYELWFDLANWSRRIKGGSLGIFRPGIPASSQFINVGLPRSQTLLLSDEQAALPRFFWDNNLDPTSLPSEAALIRALSRSTILRPSTRRTMSNDKNRDLQSALAEFVLDELQTWSGTVVELNTGSQRNTHSIQTTAIIRLCLKLDRLNGHAIVTARFKTNRRFPDDPLSFCSSRSQELWVGQESQDGWSLPLFQHQNQGKVRLDGATLDWADGQVFRDRELDWRIALPPANMRLFLPGSREGLPDGWVESSHLVPNCQFCLACRCSECERVEAWAAEHCDTIQQLPLTGLPNDWALYIAKNARSSTTNFDILRIPERRRLHIVGGITAGGKNTFFHFNRPSITLDGGSGTVTCSACPLSVNQDGLWSFPDTVPVNTPLRVECSEEWLTLTFQPAELCLKYEAQPLDKWGSLSVNEGVAWGVQATEHGLPVQPAIVPTHLGGHIVFLGRHAGQMVDWPSDQLPHNWEPVWAIVKVRRDTWQAHFVGSPVHFEPVRQHKQGLWKRWRETLLRATTVPVGIKSVRLFWAQCRQEANKL